VSDRPGAPLALGIEGTGPETRQRPRRVDEDHRGPAPRRTSAGREAVRAALGGQPLRPLLSHVSHRASPPFPPFARSPISRTDSRAARRGGCLQRKRKIGAPISRGAFAALCGGAAQVFAGGAPQNAGRGPRDSERGGTAHGLAYSLWRRKNGWLARAPAWLSCATDSLNNKLA